MPGDEDLVTRARQGDREAFGQLVKKVQRRVYATAFHLTHNHSDADDVAQEALMRAYRGLPSFDGRADFTTWLHRIVVNVALNHLRSRKRTQREISVSADDDEASELAAPEGNDPRSQAESRELVAQVVTALSQLSPSLRVTLILATVEEMSYRDIAQTLSIPEGTVAWRVNQARRVLRMKLAAVLPTQPGDGSVDDMLRRAQKALGAP